MAVKIILDQTLKSPALVRKFVGKARICGLEWVWTTEEIMPSWVVAIRELHLIKHDRHFAEIYGDFDDIRRKFPDVDWEILSERSKRIDCDTLEHYYDYIVWKNLKDHQIASRRKDTLKLFLSRHKTCSHSCIPIPASIAHYSARDISSDYIVWDQGVSNHVIHRYLDPDNFDSFHRNGYVIPNNMIRKMCRDPGVARTVFREYPITKELMIAAGNSVDYVTLLKRFGDKRLREILVRYRLMMGGGSIYSFLCNKVDDISKIINHVSDPHKLIRCASTIDVSIPWSELSAQPIMSRKDIMSAWKRFIDWRVFLKSQRITEEVYNNIPGAYMDHEILLTQGHCVMPACMFREQIRAMIAN